MLSEKQFRERARSELREIRNQVLSLARDRDVYWKVERDVIERNPQLHGVRNAFLDMVSAAYADAMAARVLRLLDPENSRSLPAASAEPAGGLSRYAARQVDRTRVCRRSCRAGPRRHHLEAGVEPALRAITNVRCRPWPPRIGSSIESIDAIISTLKTYYWIIADAHLDFEVSYPEDPLAIFQFAWTK